MSGGSPAAGGFAPGSRIAGYLLEEQIGQGGMAVVFRAHDERLDRTVALKILAPALAADEAFRQRFIRESRAAAAVDDPHIIPVFEAGEASGVLFIAMRYVRGGDVRGLVSQFGPLPPGRVAEIVSQVSSALDAAHGRGLVHRDVKPANLLLDAGHVSGRPDHVYLSDFGLSKNPLAPGKLTATGQFVGTLDYMSPEQVSGRQVDGRTDQYALACAAFELLSGAPPFQRGIGVAMMYAQLSEPPPPLTKRRPDLPADADRVFARALAKEPADRYRNCQEFAEALRAAVGLGRYLADPAPAQPQPAQPPRAPAQPTELPRAQPPPAQLPPAQLPPAQLPPAQLPPAQLPSAQLLPTQPPPGQPPPGQPLRTQTARDQPPRAEPQPVQALPVQRPAAQRPAAQPAAAQPAAAQPPAAQPPAPADWPVARVPTELNRVRRSTTTPEPVAVHHGPAPKSRRRWPVTAAALIVLAGLAGGGYVLLHSTNAALVPGPVIFTSDFSGGARDWAVIPNAADGHYRHGAYIVKTRSSGTIEIAVPQHAAALSPGPGVLSVAVTARSLGASASHTQYGITCRSDDQGNHYLFTVQDKTVLIAKTTFDGKNYHYNKLSPATSAPINDGAPNVLRADCIGMGGQQVRLVFWVNGKKLIDVTDKNALANGEVGVFTNFFGHQISVAKAQFRKFSVSRL